MYTDSERKIGLALSSVRSKVYIATKTTATDVKGFWSDLEQSLGLLQTDYIDIYQFHNPAFCPKPGDGTGLYEAMEEARAQGKIRFIGITNHRPGIAEEAIESGLYDTLQFPFCYLASQKDIEIVKKCKEKDIGFIAMKGMSGGLITNSAAAFSWMERFDNVLPIWGIQRENELDEFITYANNFPDNNDINAIIDRDREELIGSFCRACGYCMPCPVGIEINTCARMSQLIRRSPSANWLTDKSKAMMLNINNCLNCGMCSSKCPYNLDTPALLRSNLADYINIINGTAAIN